MYYYYIDLHFKNCYLKICQVLLVTLDLHLTYHINIKQTSKCRELKKFNIACNSQDCKGYMHLISFTRLTLQQDKLQANPSPIFIQPINYFKPITAINNNR